MPDFGLRWIHPEKLDAGGQAQTYTVDDAESPGTPRRVAKVLNNPKEDRRARFLQEVELTETFDHPHVVRSIASGETVKSRYPFFVMPYYDCGALESNFDRLGSPIDRLKLFEAICQGVAYAHSKKLIHRDLKPANIFMEKAGVPIVGDFGLCYRAENDKDERNTQTAEAVGARKYMPPEWREGRVDDPHATGDIYSLGKILYFIFVGRVYDGSEDDHTTDHPLVPKSDVLQNQIPQSPQRWIMARWLVDELVSRTVRKKPSDRVSSVEGLIGLVRDSIDRVESDGRVLDLNLPKRCLFCAAGTYQYPANVPFWPHHTRRNPPQPSQSWHFKTLQESIKGQLGFGAITPGPIPMYLVCNVCGNVQYFRLDLTTDKFGAHWNP